VADIAAQIAGKVNAQLAAGYTMDGTTRGKPLFVYNPAARAICCRWRRLPDQRPGLLRRRHPGRHRQPAEAGGIKNQPIT
jgi:hypothetical protein